MPTPPFPDPPAGWDTRAAPPPSAALERALASMRPVRTREPRRALAVVAVGSLIYAAPVAWALGVRGDLSHLPMFPFVLYAATCLASFVTLLRAALVPPAGQVLPNAATAGRAAWAMLAALVLLDLVVAATAPDVRFTLPAGGWRQVLAAGVPCLLSALGIVSVPIALGLLSLRRLLPFGGWRVVLALGGAAGALAGLVLHLHCPMTDPAHVSFIHGAALVVPGLVLAAALGTGRLSSRPKVDKRGKGKDGT